MPVHLYGVLDAALDASTLPSLFGLDGRAVRALPLGARSAWVSELDEPKLTATPKRLHEHDAVLREAIANGASVVPARLGRLYADDAAVLASLASHASTLDDSMILVRGRVEMSILIAPVSTEPGEASRVEVPSTAIGAGREHLLRARTRLHGERNLLGWATELAEEISRRVGGLTVAERVVANPAPPVLASRTHLIAREDVARYLSTAKSAADESERAFRVVIRGPGAAYSFAVLQSG